MNINIEQLFQPKDTDKKYTQDEILKISLILRTDSYKFSHPFAYKPGIRAMVSYGCARIDDSEIIVPFGIQILLKKYLREAITMDDINIAEQFSIKHFGRKLFSRESWEKVVKVYSGKIPLVIRSVPEGTILRGGLPIYTVSCFDADLAWMSAGFETIIQRGVWYPTTIATNDYNVKKDITGFYETTATDKSMIPFSYHDFGGRGVSCSEQAEIGGAAHTVNFMGSDTIEGIIAANFYYKNDMAAFSVYATEHSVECSFGPNKENAIEYIRTQLQQVKKLGLPIVSIVLDGYDVYREAAICCNELKQDIIDCGAKVVFRPDSGDMLVVVPKLLRMQDAAFGHTYTASGHKKINNVGIIQGDGVDRLSINTLLSKVTIGMGYSADCVIFGSGGALLQKVNRDTLKFAQKACAILTDNGWEGIAKNPVTDQGKKSKEGVLTTVRNKVTGELSSVRLDTGELDESVEDIMELVYFKGDLYNEVTLDEVRARVS